jgi:hypothetical protein
LLKQGHSQILCLILAHASQVYMQQNGIEDKKLEILLESTKVTTATRALETKETITVTTTESTSIKSHNLPFVL